MVYWMSMHCWFCVILRFWKFPETAWRVTNHRQATHAISCVLGSWKRNRLAAHSWPPGDARRLNQFLGLLMMRLAGLVEPPGGAGQSDSFWVFWNSGLNLIGAKVSGNSYRVILLTNDGYNHVIKGLNEWNSVYKFRVEWVISLITIWTGLVWIGHRNSWSM